MVSDSGHYVKTFLKEKFVRKKSVFDSCSIFLTIVRKSNTTKEFSSKIDFTQYSYVFPQFTIV